MELFHYCDGHLCEEPLAELTTRIRRAVERWGVDLLLVFDEGGITGHADHCRSSEAAAVVARELAIPALAWAWSEWVADALNLEFNAKFVGRAERELDFVVPVSRARQRRAIDQHVSQAADNPVLGR